MMCKNCEHYDPMGPGIGWCPRYKEIVSETEEHCETIDELFDREVEESNV